MLLKISYSESAYPITPVEPLKQFSTIILEFLKIVLGSMRNNVHTVIRIIDVTLNLQQEYDMYINGGVASIMMKKIP